MVKEKKDYCETGKSHKIHCSYYYCQFHRCLECHLIQMFVDLCNSYHLLASYGYQTTVQSRLKRNCIDEERQRGRRQWRHAYSNAITKDENKNTILICFMGITLKTPEHRFRRTRSQTVALQNSNKNNTVSNYCQI